MSLPYYCFRKYLRHSLFLLLCFITLAGCSDTTQDNLKLINDMFTHVSEAKTLNTVPDYFREDFVLESNRQILNYRQFNDHLAQAYKIAQRIEIKRPFQATIVEKDKVAIRGKIIVTIKGSAKETDYIAIFQIKDRKIYRWWELTYPDWATKK